MSLLLPLDVKWPYAKDQHGFPVFGAAAISEGELKSVVVAVNNHERLVEALENLHRDSLSSFDYRGSPRCAEVDALLAALEAEKGGEL